MRSRLPRILVYDLAHFRSFDDRRSQHATRFSFRRDVQIRSHGEETSDFLTQVRFSWQRYMRLTKMMPGQWLEAGALTRICVTDAPEAPPVYSDIAEDMFAWEVCMC